MLNLSFSRKYNLYKISCLIIGTSIVGSMVDYESNLGFLV